MSPSGSVLLIKLCNIKNLALGRFRLGVKSWALLLVGSLGLFGCQNESQKWQIHYVDTFNTSSVPSVDKWGNLSLTDSFNASLDTELTRPWATDVGGLGEVEPVMPGTPARVRSLLVSPKSTRVGTDLELRKGNYACLSQNVAETTVDAMGKIRFPLHTKYFFSDGPNLEGTLYWVIEVSLDSELYQDLSTVVMAFPFNLFERDNMIKKPTILKDSFEDWTSECATDFQPLPEPKNDGAFLEQVSMARFSAPETKDFPEGVSPFDLFARTALTTPASITRFDRTPWRGAVHPSLKSSILHYLSESFQRIDQTALPKVRQRQLFGPLARQLCDSLFEDSPELESCIGSPLKHIKIDALEFLTSDPEVLEESHSRENLQIMAAFLVEDTEAKKQAGGWNQSETTETGNIGKGGLEFYSNGGGIFSSWSHNNETYVAYGTSKSTDSKIRGRTREVGDFLVQRKTLRLRANVERCLRFTLQNSEALPSQLYCRAIKGHEFKHDWYYIQDSGSYQGFMNRANDSRNSDRWVTLLRGADTYNGFRELLTNSVLKFRKFEKHQHRTRELYREVQEGTRRRHFRESFPKELGEYPGLLRFSSTD